MSGLDGVLGPYVVTTEGNRVDTAVLMAQGDRAVVGLYFSAAWCAPCRGFTPKLVRLYNHLQPRLQGETETTFHIVYVSSDHNEQAFKEYFSEMPWFALPYTDRQRKVKLAKKYKVQGIPMLVLLEGHSGKVITVEGRNSVLDDPEGKLFPWYPILLGDLLKGPLKSKSGDVDSETILRGKIKGLYFSAHWCPPCRSFTPELVKTYEKLRGSKKNFEVILVSSDRSEESFNNYFQTMPWLAIPYDDPRIAALRKYFGVQGIPVFILVDEHNELITTNGRGFLMKDPHGQHFPWYPRPLEELNSLNAQILNETACLIYFTDGEEDHIKHAGDLLFDTAQTYMTEFKQSKDTPSELLELAFFYEGVEGSDVVDYVREFASLDDRCPLLALLDIPEMRLYVQPEGEITTDTINSIIQDYKTDSLQYEPLKR